MMTPEKALLLAGKKVIVLGGTSGIGLATAKAASAEGAHVTVVSGNADRVAAALEVLPSGSSGYTANLGGEQAIRELFEKTGPLDHLVYTAGENLKLDPVAGMDLEAAKAFFNIRYWGALAAVKYAAPLIRDGGSINLTGGIAAARPGAGWSIGASICGAMEAFTRAMAVELAPVRVNLVAPGVIKTNLWNGFAGQDRSALFDTVAQSALVKRVGEADDIAKAFLYLMTQSFCTGQSLVVDGGSVLA